MSAIGGEERIAHDLPVIAQQGSLVDFHNKLGHLNHDSIERLANDPDSRIKLTDRALPSCLTCAQENQINSRQPQKDSRDHSLTDRIGEVVCFDQKASMIPRN